MSVAAITFGLVFLAEVADTSGLVTLVLASRLPARWVLVGVCAGMLVQVGVALVAGSLLALLPERPLEAVLALVFLVGAFLIWREGEEDDDDDDEVTLKETPRTAWSVVADRLRDHRALGVRSTRRRSSPRRWSRGTATPSPSASVPCSGSGSSPRSRSGAGTASAATSR